MDDLVQRLRRMCGNDPNAIVTQAADRIERLERENAELRKDAERLQWIVDNDVDACHLLRTTSGTFIRREIDEAMKS